MRILAVYPYVPWPLNRGAYHRAYHLLKGIAVDHEIDLLALSENGEGGEHADVFRKFCHSVRVVPFQHPPWPKLFPKRILNRLPSTVTHWSVPHVAREINEGLASAEYGAVHVLDLVLAQFFPKANPNLPLVLDRTRVDLQYQWMEQKRMNFSLKSKVLSYENSAKLWAFERKVAGRCALQVLCGPDDKTFVRRYISRNVPLSVIPNGVDLEFFRPDSVSDARAAEPTVIFCGAMDYNPNVDALRWFFAEMHAPLCRLTPDLRVLVVGKDPTSEVRRYGELPGVTVTGAVPDVRPYYRKAWLQIVPLRIGGGTRLKIVESLGMRTPVVSTTIGAQGLGLRAEHEILYGDTVDEFVRQTARALKDNELRRVLEENGLKAVGERLSWDRLGKELNETYKLVQSELKTGSRKTLAGPEELVSQKC